MRILIAIPAYNEAAVLDTTLQTLTAFCTKIFSADDWQIVVADNRSTDQTAAIIQRWASQNNRVTYLSVPTPGKGEAILSAWQHGDSDAYYFMDADLATDLSALPKLVEAIASGADVAIGSRALPHSRVERSWVRRCVSAGYRLMARILVGTHCTDLPCGFKAINQHVKESIVPNIVNRKWFFDSELVLRAERAQLKIVEVPVDWAERRPEGNKSRVNVFLVGLAYVRELWRMRSVRK